MFWIRWSIQGLISRGRSTALFLIFLVIIHCLSILLIALLGGATSQTNQSVYALNGIISLSGPTDGFAQAEIETAVKIIHDISGGELSSTLLASSTMYLVNSNGYFSVRAHASNPANEKSIESIIEPSIAWIAKSAENFGTGSVIVPGSLASEMNLSIGDSINGYKESVGGRVHSIPLKIWGIYMGSELIFGNSVFLVQKDLETMVDLPGFVSSIVVPYPGNKKDPRAEAWNVYRALSAEYKNVLPLKSDYLFPYESDILSVFSYYTGFTAALLSLFMVCSQIVCGISINNSVYLDFYSRKAEFSTLRTFGLKNKYLYNLIGLQALWVTIVSFLLALCLTLLVGVVLSLSIEIKDPLMGELINLLGGPRPKVELDLIPVSAYFLWSLSILVMFSLFGVRHYLRSSVRSKM